MLTLERSDVVDWAVGRWKAEVANRPLQNVHRRSLDTTWRQVIRRFGGDDIILCGPAHDELLAASPPLPVAEREWQPTHRHVKRGTEYQVVGQAQVQSPSSVCTCGGLTDYEIATVYRDAGGHLWVRRKSEFEDGRFVPLPAPPLLAEQGPEPK